MICLFREEKKLVSTFYNVTLRVVKIDVPLGQLKLLDLIWLLT